MIKFLSIIKLEFQLELNQQFSWLSLFLYLTSSIYVSYLGSSGIISPNIWGVLFWLLLLFLAVNTVAKSFTGTGSKVLNYYLNLMSPKEFIFGKIVFNTLYLFGLGLLGTILFKVFFGNQAFISLDLILILFISCISLSGIFSLMATLSMGQSNAITLITILGFPIVLPVFITSIHLTNKLNNGFSLNGVLGDLTILTALATLIMAFSVLLFPYLCRD